LVEVQTADIFLHRLALVAIIQFVSFALMRQQKRTYQFFGLGDAIRLTKTISFAVIGSGLIIALVSPEFRYQDYLILIYDLFFLSALTIGMSLSYRVLHYLSYKQRLNAKGVLIYGADSTGLLTLNRVLSTNLENWKPVGFIDDNPALSGRYLNGFPIFGSHSDIQSILTSNSISEIIICGENITDDAIQHVEKVSRNEKVKLKRIRILYEDFHPDESRRMELHKNPIRRGHFINLLGQMKERITLFSVQSGYSSFD
jgi:FlaA1/EpsC-like NDP-sugar epimerase